MGAAGYSLPPQSISETVMKRIHSLLLATTFVAVTIPALAQMPTTPPGAPDPTRVVAGTYTVEPSHSQVAFTVNHLGFSFYRGIFGDITGSMTLDPKTPAGAKVSIDIPITKVVTTAEKLNEHLQKPEFFDSAKFPTAHFESTSVVAKGMTATISGNLTIKGVTKPVVLKAKFVGAGHSMLPGGSIAMGFEATTTVKRSDFGISYGIPLVPDDVPLDIAVAFEKAK
ncbi:Polyisoprenoid-binding protein YceI [Sphingomonas sp. YR710]|jgi:polyisoprenoid-binding protein YceI|nr:Polyisoprenoid-binding protein YceI [Sphingomonas sp. YR710]